MVLLVDDNPESRSVHNGYHCARLDDLGRGYRNAAIAETGNDKARPRCHYMWR